MKDGFQAIEIEPINGFLDFIGPAKEPSSETNQLLKGEVRLELTKAIKVKSMTIKFKGTTTTSHPRISDKTTISAQILPKLKTTLFSKSTTLPPGKHILPWELEIPNIYPRSISIKRGSVNYKVELTISLGIKNTITEEYPILIKRHLLPCKQLAPVVNTKSYSNTISTRFHYDIESPRIICVEQGYVPVVLKYLSIGNQKAVKSIRTQIIQVESYRNRKVSKAETDMSVNAHNKNLVMGHAFNESTLKNAEVSFSKYGKRILPIITHHLTPEFNTKQKPLLLSHQLNPYLIPGIDSPLASIYHQLEITFNFGHEHDEIKAKIPIIVSSVPSIPKQLPIKDAKPCYAMELLPHQDPSYVEIKNEMLDTDSNKMVAESYYQSLVDITNNLFGSDRSTSGPSLRRATSEQTISTIEQTVCTTDTQSTIRRNSVTTQTQQFLAPISLPKKRVPAPLDVHLANKINLLSVTQSSDNANKNVDVKDVEAELNQLYEEKEEVPLNHFRNGIIGLAPPPRGGRIKEAKPEITAHLLDSVSSFEEDTASIYSDTSFGSRIAPSLASSATESSGMISLQSRPASPVFYTAPGLPATTALRPTNANHMSLIEETFGSSFSPDIPNSPHTVASSAIFSPHTSFAMMGEHYTQSNQSFQSRPESTATDMTGASLSYYYQQIQSLSSLGDEESSAAKRYFHAELPPVPQDKKANRRTRIYYQEEESDDDDDDQLPDIVENTQPPQPPQLPRLSLGHSFAFSLD
ncbi:hypothetical protein K501DRAFT_330808 [Backusella circina FSU 941]|nr:hypothetical protein K501DRAFT_330808 [Backusella circina FSU 941]